ncbi:MAG: 2,3-bisphosphoglycerate-independent phosphoglycerate mutase [Planctomycetes bacterium]|nr:2,3-bisphosphoglycerate-independent phosphoglycerate mutase [Planctomycetota bacterium]
MSKRPVAIIIRDGWGYNENPKGNSVHDADTCFHEMLKSKYPWMLLDACGEAVGLPAGYQGSSEVGHLNMGAGRVVVQELKRIDDGLTSGDLFKEPKWVALVKNWKDNKSALHLMGLLQDEGVHAHQEHLFKIMRRARQENPEGKIVIHPFLDGRDTPPRSTLEYVAKLDKVIAEVGNCVIGTIQGRYYAMDRSKNWELTSRAYDFLVTGQNERREKDVATAVKYAYDHDKTPDGDPMCDEYIMPCAIGDYAGMKDGDCVFHTNYRQDRAIQLTLAFTADDYPGKRAARPKVTYLGFTRYFDEFKEYLMGPLGGDGGMKGLLGEVVSNAGMKQLRLAETQKFRHVTSFFNGKSTKPFPGETQVEVPSRYDPATFATHPEMECFTVTDKLMQYLAEDPYQFDLIVVNYANCDMVGHTGQPDAARNAVAMVDKCVGALVDVMLGLDFQILITADHGNADQMVDYETGMVKTSHTLNPVELIYVAKDAPGKKLKADKKMGGKLGDIAVTALHLLGLPKPPEMTADDLIVG